MRAFALVAFLIFTLPAQFAEAQIRNFPYEAKVVVDAVFVRSGAGDSYYPTQKLPRETVVTVHRHDPGGWYMIDPPPGSFSWIPERYVKRLNDTEGEVAEESVIAFVGSEFGDEASVFQRRLKTGEKITILGQRQIISGNGPQAMLQIAPPTRERRWPSTLRSRQAAVRWRTRFQVGARGCATHLPSPPPWRPVCRIRPVGPGSSRRP